ncbi:MAG: FkbM family methyltransferase [Planctomycetes bacterium]|nr:FkbM family methyltransferase [Planctomycetota bacterium]
MGLIKKLRKLRDRLTGSRLNRGRTLAPRARRAIERGLREGKFDAPTAEYLRAHLPFLINQKRVANLAFFCGNTKARTLLGLKREDVEQNPVAFYEKIKAWEKDGIFDFKGIRLLEPDSKEDIRLFAHEFIDNLLPAVIGRDQYDIVRGLGLEGPYEVGKVRLSPGDVVVDAGANMGMFSALAARAGCRVLAFEPITHVREKYLLKNAELNGNIEILPYALSDRREELQFCFDEKNLGASCRADDGQEWSSGASAVETVQAVTLDDIVRDRGIARIDFIKADIEGSERRLLLGAKNVLKNFAPKLSLCTYHLPDDRMVLKKIILEIQPEYRIVQRESKLYASVK